MMKKLSFVSLLAAIIKKVEANTSERCYDIVPQDAPLPHYAVEVVGQEPAPGKTMWKEKYHVILHAWANGKESSVPILDMVQKLEEALTEQVELEEGYEITMQVPKGLQKLIEDQDGSKHAVMSYEFTIFYGYKMKI